MEEPTNVIERQKKLLLENLKATKCEECVEGCDGEWLVCVEDTLARNNMVKILIY